jgi:hypothetical protein
MGRRPLALLALTLLGWLTTGPARADLPPVPDFRPDPASVQRYGPAYRYPQAGWIVLHIEGKPYERGYQHGRLLANEIAAYVRCFANMMSSKAPSDGWRHTRTLTNALFLRRFHKEYLEEMKGIADGASAAGARFDNRPLDVVDIAAVNCWAEIGTLPSALEGTPTGLEGIRFPHPQARAMPAPQEDHCSAFAATGPATPDGKVVFGHITMFGLYASYHYNVYLDVKPAQGHRAFMCTYPAGIQSGMDYYMNDAGLLICETTIAQTRFDIKGLTLASRIRKAIQYAGTIDEAADILRAENNGLYTNEWLLADVNTNEIAVLQLGTHKSRLSRSTKGEWFGGTAGFYWGCNNTKDVELRLETIPSVAGRPANVVFEPTARDMAWQRLYRKHKGKIGAAFGREAFTTPPIAASSSLDAKFTTTDLAKQLKTWALFGPPLGRAWQPTEDERRRYPDIRPLVSNPWTILHAEPPPRMPAPSQVAVDLPGGKPSPAAAPAPAAGRRQRAVLDVPAWRGTLLPGGDGDLWLATAFADYQRVYSREKALRARHDKKGDLTPTERDQLGLDLFAFRGPYQRAVRAGHDVPLSAVRFDWAADGWYHVAAGKGVLLLHELRRELGDRRFEEAMDAFGRKHAGHKVTTADFRSHMEKAAGKELGRLFDYWLKQTGLPVLRLEDVRMETFVSTGAEANGTKAPGYAVRGEIRRQGGETDQAVEVTVETAKGEVTETVVLKGETTPFSVRLGNGSGKAVTGRPVRVVVDKYGRAARANGGAYGILSFQPELDDTLIVYGSGEEAPANREAAELLQKALREHFYNQTVPIKSDKEVSDRDLRAHHLLLIGRPDNNAVVQRFRSALPITFGSRSFVVRNETYAHPRSAVIVAADNPLNRRYSLVVLAGLSAEATWHAPAALFRGQSGAEVLVLPAQGPTRALVLPARELVSAVADRE